MKPHRHMIEFTVDNWDEPRILTDMFKLNDLLVFKAEYDHCRQGFRYQCFAPWLEEQPEGYLPVPFELRRDYRTDKQGDTRLYNIVLVRSPVPEPMPPPPRPPCLNCQRLKKALDATHWGTVLDCLSEAHA